MLFISHLREAGQWQNENLIRKKNAICHPSQCVLGVTLSIFTTDNPHLISTIEQQKLKFLVAVNEPKKEAEGGTSDKKSSGSRRIKSEERDGGLLEGRGTEDRGTGVSRTSVGESVHQLKLMHRIPTSKKEGNEEAAATSLPTYKKVSLNECFCLPKLLSFLVCFLVTFTCLYGFKWIVEMWI